MLEYNLIKAHRPRFNIRLVDDKSYPYLAVTVGDEWPKATVMRGAKRKDTRYFGPYAHAYAIRDTLDLLLRSFPIRTCSDAKFRRHELLGRPCLMYHIERCSGPCVGAVDHEEYGRLVDELMAFLDGDTRPVVDRLEAEMRQASDELEFERAARLRDRLATVRLAIERQQMVTDTPENLDVIAIAEDELEAAVQVLHVRRGRVVGRHGFIVEKVEPLTTPQLIGRVLEQHYAETPLGIPRELLVPELPEDVATYETWLSGLREGKVQVIVPKRGRKRELLAHGPPERRRPARASPPAAGERPLQPCHRPRGAAGGARDVRSAAAHRVLRHEPPTGHRLRRLDGRDRGRSAEAKRLPALQGDRRPGQRRLRRHARGAHPAAPAPVRDAGRGRRGGRRGRRGGARRRRWSRGAGGKGTVLPTRHSCCCSTVARVSSGSACECSRSWASRGKIAVAALAKQFEEVFVPGRSDPVRIPRDSEAIYLLQQTRDEAHRFAITFHRELRGRRMTRGALDGVAGLGPARRRRLVSELGGVRAVQAASLDELLRLAWLPDAVARAVYEHLHGRRPSKAG